MFQMQSWEDDPGRWTPMEHAAGATAWRPRATAQDAVFRCAQWTGLLFIPAMQVIDLTTGDVVWRDPGPYGDDAGHPITPYWTQQIYTAARLDLIGETPHEHPPPPPHDDQLELFTDDEETT